MSVGIVWFRNDLRLERNPAWAEATIHHDTVIALYVIESRLWQSAGTRPIGALMGRLYALDRDLAEAGGRLRVRSGDALSIVLQEAGGVDAVYWNGDVTPYAGARDEAVTEALAGRAHEHDGRFVHEPGSIKTADGEPYRVFTPFYRR